MPKVSVIIPVYNSAQYISECLDSVFKQTYDDFEVIVVDDGSTDNTSDMLKNYNDKIRYFYKENGGVNTARQIGLNEAKGEYIALIDHDDVWVPDKLEKQVAFLDIYQDIDMIFSDFQNFEGHDFTDKSFFEGNKAIRKIPTKPATNIYPKCKIFTKNILYDYLRGNFIIQCTLMVRTVICKKLDMFNTQTHGREMYEFSTRAIHLLKLGFIDKVMAYRRIHNTNVSYNKELYCKNTIIICQNAIEYPWMDKKCKSFLKNELIKHYFMLGNYYFVKGRFFDARTFLKLALNKGRFHTPAMMLYGLTFVISPGMIFIIKRIYKYLLLQGNKAKPRRRTAACDHEVSLCRAVKGRL